MEERERGADRSVAAGTDQRLVRQLMEAAMVTGRINEEPVPPPRHLLGLPDELRPLRRLETDGLVIHRLLGHRAVVRVHRATICSRLCSNLRRGGLQGCLTHQVDHGDALASNPLGKLGSQPDGNLVVHELEAVRSRRRILIRY
eukprot:scaffold40912_cov63-Phaeocystis_antarctica.AAC.4